MNLATFLNYVNVNVTHLLSTLDTPLLTRSKDPSAPPFTARFVVLQLSLVNNALKHFLTFLEGGEKEGGEDVVDKGLQIQTRELISKIDLVLARQN